MLTVAKDDESDCQRCLSTAEDDCMKNGRLSFDTPQQAPSAWTPRQIVTVKCAGCPTTATESRDPTRKRLAAPPYRLVGLRRND